MVPSLTTSQHGSVNDLEREKAWHLLHVLFTIGRPVLPAELAAKCRLFTVSADSVEYLCSIPGSPLLLTEGRYVTVSEFAFSAFRQFASKAICSFVPRIPSRVNGTSRLWDGVVRNYYRKRQEQEDESLKLPSAKRRLILPSESDEDNRIATPSTSKLQASPKVQASISNGTIGNVNLLLDGTTIIGNNSRVLRHTILLSPLLHDTSVASPSNASGNIGYISDSYEGEAEHILPKEMPESLDIQQCQDTILNNETDLNIPKASICESGLDLNLPPCAREDSPLRKNLKDETIIVNEKALTPTTCLEVGTKHDTSPVKTDQTVHACRSVENRAVEPEKELFCQEEGNIMTSDAPAGVQGDLNPADMTALTLLKKNLSSIQEISHEERIKSPTRDETTSKVVNKTIFPSAEPLPTKVLHTSTSAKLKNMQRDSIHVGPKVTSKLLDGGTAVSPKQQELYRKERKGISTKEKLKKSLKVPTKENKTNPTSTDAKTHLETKALPDFESFIIEEEEGSGGYGIVYRARRKSDGKTFAIKCPHSNAHVHHVNNELKMLELFGGQNFVIKFEGSFKSNNAECFVLEHVEHDRPEVLKREIDIFQLQWYGYCMFRALAVLHKQGVAHRDVKPGNFLFSRKLSKGYLIDFNLAIDLHKKYGTTSKSKTCSTNFNHIPLPSSESAPPTKGRKVIGNRALESVCQEIAKDSRLPFEPKNIKKRADVGHLKSYPDLGGRGILKSQGADGSGITSAKDATSTRTPSAERLRQPLPYSSRKELNRLVQEAMGNPDQKAVRIPASQRKRVAAPLAKVDRKLYLTPMPLHSSGIAISGIGMVKNKGDGKHKREGPCVGTKGFRAPEVLLRSPHQGFKVDVWSAGVTMLYLMIGRTPFAGDPEQNIKEIAKLKGSEDLWEVAKLHNRESSFPVELFDVQSLPSVNLREWCEQNTKRPEFLDMIPSSLFDLVEKCLTVNPRLRISAEDALRHEFFRRCHEDLRKKRLMRKVSVESESAHLGDLQTESEVNVLHKENLTGALNVNA